MSATFARASSRFAGLDGLRAVAVIAVIQQHFGAGIYTRILSGGTFAVRLFFVLSGFLITGILLDVKGSDRLATWRAFYIRRALRIFPAYYLVLAIMCALVPEMARHWAWYALYGTNVYVGLHNAWVGAGGHLWSLAVEEQFYLLWPAVILLTPPRWLPRLMCSLVVAAPAMRYVVYAITGKGLLAVLTLPGSVDTLAIGAWLAWRWRTADAKPIHDSIGLVGAVVYIALQGLSVTTGATILPIVFSTTAMSLAGLWIVDHVAREGLGTRWLSAAPLAFIGTISYSIYLIHDFLPVLISAVLPTSYVWFGAKGTAQWLTIAALSIGWAAASWYLFERPVNNLKRYVPYEAPQPRMIEPVPGRSVAWPPPGISSGVR